MGFPGAQDKKVYKRDVLFSISLFSCRFLVLKSKQACEVNEGFRRERAKKPRVLPFFHSVPSGALLNVGKETTAIQTSFTSMFCKFYLKSHSHQQETRFNKMEIGNRKLNHWL